GIRDFHVTGVQTCALPILRKRYSRSDINQEPHYYCNTCCLAYHRKESGNRGRRAFICIRSPEVERDQGEFEAEAYQGEHYPHKRSEERRVGRESDCGEL